MKNEPAMIRTGRVCFAAGWLLAALPGLAAPAPYASDANTVYLFHFDEPSGAGVATNSATLTAGTNLVSFDGNPYAGDSTAQPIVTTLLGATGYSGFGNCADVSGGTDLGLGLDVNHTGLFGMDDGAPLSGDRLPTHNFFGAGNAFTLEALVNVATITGLSQEILSTDNASATTDRGFQFRINSAGQLEFNFIGGSTTTGTNAPIPTTGPHAFVAGQWFHAVVTGDGTNVWFYWSRLEVAATGANLIGGPFPEDVDPNDDMLLVVGNEARVVGTTGATEGLAGLIDEVRISNIARAATNFYWLGAPPADIDGDGLGDDWETNYFGNLSQGATNDFDLDTFDNLAEYTAGSNPTNSLSTPNDTDADGLPDTWEQTYFASLAQNASGDPDGDGYTNLQEYNAGTNTNNAASNPGDTDADGLPDAWEMTCFGSLAQTGSGDFDGDGFTNLAEYQAGTGPANAASRPAGVAVNLIPVEDGDTNTSEYGYAGSSAINTVNFAHTALHTENGQQFIAYYYRHATRGSDTNNNRIVIARRTVGTNIWQVFFTPFTANTITDGHDVATFGLDGDGFMHLSWGMHGDAFHYARSTTTVFGSGAIGFGPDTTMTGNENTVTYPQWLRLPNGDLLYLFREGASGSGDTYLNHYYRSSQTWSNVHVNAGQQPFLKGRGWAPDYNAYPNMPVLDSDGTFHLVWTWRYQGDSPAGESGYQTNHDFDYARSTNGGLTWLRQNGTPYALPISQSGENGDTNTTAEKILSIPEGYSLINQAGMCLDTNHQPVVATWWAPGTGTNNYRRQYLLAFRDANGAWQTRQISNRTIDATNSRKDESVVRDLGRPVVVCDTAGRIVVLYRDNQGSNGLTIVHSLPYALDPQRTNWTTVDLTTANLGNYEPVIDQARWDLDNNLHIVYQPSTGLGYTPPANTAAQMAVLEWNAAAYFAHRPTLQMAVSGGTNAVLTFNTQPGWGYRVQTSTNLTSWQTLSTLGGIPGNLEYVHTSGIGGGQRYWRVQSQEGGF